MGGRGLIRAACLAACLAACAAASAHGDGPPRLYVGDDDGSPDRKHDAGPGGCTVWADHAYDWTPLDPPLNNAPHEESLYPGDVVRGLFTHGSEGCCRVKTSGPAAVGDWSELAGVSGGSYTQRMAILPDRPTPDSSTRGAYIRTAEYDDAGRSRTHWLGAVEGHGLVAGARYTVSGYTFDAFSDSCGNLDARVSLAADFRYRNPFWETSIFEHHILDTRGYPASNLDYSQYPHDSIPLEAGSNLVLGAYRHETIRISHEVLSGGTPAKEFHCHTKTCRIGLEGAPESASYVGHAPYRGDAKNPPWHGPDPGREGMLDMGEAMFAMPAASTGPVSVASIMENGGIEVARGYNATYQFVPSYEPVMSMTPVTNTAWGGDSALERPVSAIMEYDGTISDTLHYCAVGTAYDTDGAVIPHGSTGSMDAWGRLAGDRCPEDGAKWGNPGACGTPGCSYVAHPEPPAATGWGRWSALNPETRALLWGFAGEHAICPTGTDAGECISYGTPYLNWDFVPGTDRDFIPTCVVDIIAAEGGERANAPKPENWGLKGDWGFGETFGVGEGAGPHSYRGIFGVPPGNPPDHYVVDAAHCEAALGDRECVPRGAECRPEYDRRCEDVFTPYLYPDDYIMAGHNLLQEMAVGWCGPSPTERCAAEAYGAIDGVMAAMCSRYHGVDHASSRNQVIDTAPMKVSADGFSSHICHSMYATMVYVPAIGGTPVADWRACYGVVPEGEGGVWPDGKPDADPGDACAPAGGGGALSMPYWDGGNKNVYVPYTPTTGAFIGTVERPGNMLADDGSLTCSCPDLDGNGICDRSEAGGTGDLDGNGIDDDWDALTVDGATKCLDRTGTAAAAAASCWAKYGRDAGRGGEAAAALESCLAEAGGVADGPDGECDPAVVIGRIVADGSVDATFLEDPAGLGRSLAEFAADPDLAGRLAIPFQAVGGIIPIPYVVDGEHVHCDESEPWCISSGDTYLEHDRRAICEDPDMPISVKRIPAPATMPPLYRPIFDENWPPPCLPEYPVGEWSRPEHDAVSLDLAGMDAQWPTAPPPYPGMGTGRTPSHVSTDRSPGEGPDHTMMLHAGTGVLRFAACGGCADPPLSGGGEWIGMVRTEMGGAEHVIRGTMGHPPYVLSQETSVRAVAVEPCDTCERGWREAASEPGISMTLTAYPETRTPAAEPAEMAAAGCQMDGDRGTGVLNFWDALVAGPAGAGELKDYWNGMTCRDIPGISITVQDYEAARHGPAAKREAGQPWTVAEGVNDVGMDVLRNGLWLSTLNILGHRGQCATYAWSQGITPGHTSCPDTARDLAECLSGAGGAEYGGCLERASGRCAGVYVEDKIHKQWEFSGYGGGDAPVVYRMPDGSYAGMGGDGDTMVPMDAGRLAWEPGLAGEDMLLRCEVAVGADGTMHGVEHGIPAEDVDLMRGGSFACQEVEACKSERTTYKCLGGEVVPHVVCDEPADSYSVLDMPYQDVMSGVAAQKLHIEAACPAGHAHVGKAARCDGRPIYDTHTISDGAAMTTIYVDYFGVGRLAAGRGDPSSHMIHLRPPETFGAVHSITVDPGDGDRVTAPGTTPCTACMIEHPGAAEITIHNRYGATLTAAVDAAEPLRPSVIQADEISGAAWLYLPALAAGAAIYVVIRKYQGMEGRG